MATDPRLDAATLGTAFGSGPATNAVLLARLAALEKRIAVLERTATIQAGSGPPTAATRDGTPYLDVTNSRIYFRSAGTWKSVVIA